MQSNEFPANGRRSFIRQAVFAGLSIFLPVNTIGMFNPRGVILQVSRFSVDSTVSRLMEILNTKGAKIYAVIDQRDELSKAGINIPPMKFILFGNPRSGGAILAANPIAGLDLPLKVLVWEDNNGIVYVGYNDPGYVKERYGLSQPLSDVLDLSPLMKAVLGP